MGAPEFTAKLPVRLQSAANLREHWTTRHRRVKAERALGARLAVNAVPLPAIVILTRIAPRRLDDDNLRSAFKGVRDGIADKLGVADNDSRVRWEYSQARGRPREYGIHVRVVSSPIGAGVTTGGAGHA